MKKRNSVIQRQKAIPIPFTINEIKKDFLLKVSLTTTMIPQIKNTIRWMTGRTIEDAIGTHVKFESEIPPSNVIKKEILAIGIYKTSKAKKSNNML